ACGDDSNRNGNDRHAASIKRHWANPDPSEDSNLTRQSLELSCAEATPPVLSRLNSERAQSDLVRLLQRVTNCFRERSCLGLGFRVLDTRHGLALHPRLAGSLA